MPVLFTCPRGHQWQRISGGDEADNLCPVCGSPSSFIPVEAVAASAAGLASTVAAGRIEKPAAIPPFGGALPQLPGLEMHSMLGQGGMGIVYRAWQPSHQRWVAVKVIRRDRQANPELVRRFHREAHAATRLMHPSFVLVYEANLETEPFFLVMELVDGITLQNLVGDQGPLPIAHACEYLRQVAEGLQHIQEQALVHRDIKPSNLMVMKGRPGAAGMVKILDMGVVKVHQLGESPAEMLSTLTQKGSLLGTLDFIAPEQLEDARGADARADLYSLGCTFYYLLTGQVPFPDPNPIRKVDGHRWQTAAAVDQLRPEIPERVAAVIRKLMAKKPRDRYQTATELLEDLQRLARGSDVSATIGPPTTGPLRCFIGHTDSVWAVAFAPDGQLAVSGGKDRTVRLWQVSSGEQVEILGEQAQEIRSVAFAPDGNLLAVATGAGIRLVDSRTGREETRLTGHSDIVRAVGFTADGWRLVSCGDDRTARVWDVGTGRELLRFARHRGAVSCLALSAEGEAVLTGGRDNRLRLWSVRNGQALRDLVVPNGQVLAVALSCDTKHALSGHFDTILRLWDLERGRELRRLPGHRQMITCAGFANKDQYLISGSQDRTLRVWDVRSGAEICRCAGHEAGVTALAVSPATPHVISASLDKTLRLWSLPSTDVGS
jgi:serine/threonine protein kinase